MVQFLIKIYIAYLYHVLGNAIHAAHSNRRGLAANIQTHEIKIQSVLKWPMLVAACARVIFFCNFWNILFYKLCEMPATRCSSAWMLITIFIWIMNWEYGDHYIFDSATSIQIEKHTSGIRRPSRVADDEHCVWVSKTVCKLHFPTNLIIDCVINLQMACMIENWMQKQFNILIENQFENNIRITHVYWSPTNVLKRIGTLVNTQGYSWLLRVWV